MISLSNFPACERLIIGLALILVIVAPTGLAYGQEGGVFRSDRDQSLPTTFVMNETSGSGSCAIVHSGLRVPIGMDVSSNTHSGPVTKAISAGDPFGQTKPEAEINWRTQLQTITEDQRSHCHTLMTRVQVLPTGFPAVLVGYRFLIPAHPLTGAAMDGVSCVRCHQL